jgi:hypothetical protein
MFMRAGWKEIFREAGLHDYPQLWFYKWIGHDKKHLFQMPAHLVQSRLPDHADA